MKHFVPFTSLEAYCTPRAGETRLGECVSLHATGRTQFELFGIPESVGVKANLGIGGSETAWPSFLKSFLNLQSNRYFDGSTLYLSGYFAFPEPEEDALEGLREAVAKQDVEVAERIEAAVTAGRIPIVIGGGHNNAYPILKGASRAIGKPLAAINMDAHADLRRCEGRHSGNGFTYAFQDGYLERYTVFGLQSAYAPEYMLEHMANDPRILVHPFDILRQASPSTFRSTLKDAVDHASPFPLGIELDLDSVENVLSSATSPFGFTPSQALDYIATLKSVPSAAYLHICEGATALEDGRSQPSIGKLIAALVYEFLRKEV